MAQKNTFYLVGNAHLDPVWQWRRQEVLLTEYACE